MHDFMCVFVVIVIWQYCFDVPSLCLSCLSFKTMFVSFISMNCPLCFLSTLCPDCRAVVLLVAV